MNRKEPRVIVADMGATYSRLAFIDEYQAVRNVKTYSSHNFDSPREVILAYLADLGEEEADHILIAVAAPITDDQLNLKNIHWNFSQQDIAKEFNGKVTFINDFEALSSSLQYLSHNDLIAIGSPSAANITSGFQTRVVIGTGTGFGTALNIQSSFGNFSIPSEGGQAIYAPQDAEEIELVKIAQNELNRPVIIEDFLACKAGITRLIELLADIHDKEISFERTPKGLLTAAIEQNIPFAQYILNRYCMMLGNTAGNIAVTAGANAGVYIGGGFAPRFAQFIQQSSFRDCFVNKISVKALLEEIPTFVITHPYATLVGLQQLLPRYL